MADSFLCIKKPKRCLTAYNLFFHSERQKLMDELHGNKNENENGDKEQDSEPKKGKIGFAPLAQKISARWKVITDEDKAHFEYLAKQDRIRYDKEMDNWRAAQAKLERLLQDAPEVALAALQSQKLSSDKKRKRKPATTKKKEKKLKADPACPPKKIEEKVPKKPAALSAPPMNLKKSATTTGLFQSQCTEAAQTQAIQFPKRMVSESNANTHFSVPRMVSNNELPQARSVNNMFCNNGNNANETFSGPRQVSVMQLGAWKNHGHDSTAPMQMQGNGNIASLANATFPFLPSPPAAYHHPQQPQQSATSPMTTFQQEMLFGNDAPSSSTPAFHTSFPKQDSTGFSNRCFVNAPTKNAFQQGQEISDDSFRSELGHSLTTDELNVSCSTTSDWWGWSHHQGQDHVQDSASHHQENQRAFLTPNEPIYNDDLNFHEAFSQLGQEEATRVMCATQMSLAAPAQQANGHFAFPCFASMHSTDDTTGHNQQSNYTVSVTTNLAFQNSA